MAYDLPATGRSGVTATGTLSPASRGGTAPQHTGGTGDGGSAPAAGQSAGASRAPRDRHCSACGQPGHNRNNRRCARHPRHGDARGTPATRRPSRGAAGADEPRFTELQPRFFSFEDVEVAANQALTGEARRVVASVLANVKQDITAASVLKHSGRGEAPDHLDFLDLFMPAGALISLAKWTSAALRKAKHPPLGGVGELKRYFGTFWALSTYNASIEEVELNKVSTRVRLRVFLDALMMGAMHAAPALPRQVWPWQDTPARGCPDYRLMSKERFRRITSCLRIAKPAERASSSRETWPDHNKDPADDLRDFEALFRQKARSLLFVQGMHLSGDDDSNPTQSGDTAHHVQPPPPCAHPWLAAWA